MNSKALHLVFFFDSFRLGGAERYGLYLAYHFNNVGHKVTVITFDHKIEFDLNKFFFNGPLDYQLIEFGFEKTNHFYRIRQLLKIIPKLKSLKADVFLPFTIRPNVVCSSVWKFSGAKMCIWNQQDEGFGLTFTGRDKILLRAVKNASKIVSNSNKGLEAMSRLVKDTTKLIYIPNGIRKINREGILQMIWRNKLNINSATFVVTKLANLTSNKDHITVIKAWKIFLNKISNQNTEAVLVLGGRKEETFGVIEDLINELGLKKTVFCAGEIANVYEFLVDANIAVHSSLSEGVPNSVLECMNIGLPVIASKIDGHIEALSSKHSLYFEAGNENELAELIFKCYTKQIDLNEIKSDQEEIISNKYAIDKLYSSFEKLIQPGIKYE